MTLQSINPATGKLIETFEEHTPQQIQSKIEKAYEAFGAWSQTGFRERALRLKKAAEILRKNKKKYAQIITSEMGKIISSSISEVEKCAWNCDFYAERSEEFLKEEIIQTEFSKSSVRFEPLGIILAIMPWNFPFWQVFRFAAPALMAGNVMLLKHASNVCRSALTMEDIFSEAGFTEAIFQTLLMAPEKVNSIIAHPYVRAVTLTGSDRTGSHVAQCAGREIKKTVLELGGSDPFIVLEDADIEAACEVGVKARLQANGQSCVAAKRFIVVKSIAQKFQTRFVEKMQNLTVGDPLDEKTQLGPLAREDLLVTLHKQVEESVRVGAQLLVGGKRLPREGIYYPPTVLTGVKKGMPAYHEELFGPVAALIEVPNETEALSVANDSPYGLGASIWTKDVLHGQQLAVRIQAGIVFINDFVRSDSRLPFGGVKRSGYGRELGAFGIREWTNVKTVCVK